MIYASIPQSAQNDKKAIAACDKLAAEIDAINSELAAINVEAAAVANEALNGSEVDASALIKRIAMVKVRKLAVAIREKRLTALETAFKDAVMTAAKAEVQRLQQALDRREGELNKVADGLGYGPTAIQRTQLVRTDRDRNYLIGLKNTAGLESSSYKFTVNEPARIKELDNIILGALKL